MSFCSAFGQKKNKAQQDAVPSSNVPSADSLYRNIYRTGLAYGDYRVCIDAIYYLKALHPEQRNYRDTLALLYMQSGNYVQAIVVGREVLTDSPTNVHILSAVAFSEEKMGRNAEALEMYQQLDQLNPNLYYSYQVSSLQYRLGRLPQAMIALNKIIGNPTSTKENVDVSVGETSQSVSYKAAALNLLGVVYKEMGSLNLSAQSFQQALEQAPDFQLAKENLNILMSSTSEKAAPTGGNKNTSTNNKPNPVKKK